MALKINCYTLFTFQHLKKKKKTHKCLLSGESVSLVESHLVYLCFLGCAPLFWAQKSMLIKLFRVLLIINFSFCQNKLYFTLQLLLSNCIYNHHTLLYVISYLNLVDNYWTAVRSEQWGCWTFRNQKKLLFLQAGVQFPIGSVLV